MLDRLEPGSALVLDAGNALFANAGVASDAEKARAAFILKTMERFGTKAMAVGQRDLSAGLEYLEGLGKGSKMKLLSANLQRVGKRVFDAGVVIDVSGVKVGIVGLTAVGPVAPDKGGVMAGPTLEAARAALQQLGPRELTIILAATSYADAMQLSTQLAGEVDFVIQSGEFRGTVPAQRMDERSALLFASGQRGQALARVQVVLGGAKGPFVDLSTADREREQLEFLRAQIKTLEERHRSAADKSGAADLLRTLNEMRKRQTEAATALAKKVAPAARTAKLEWVALGQDIVDDAATKAEVLKYEPTYAGAH